MRSSGVSQRETMSKSITATTGSSVIMKFNTVTSSPAVVIGDGETRKGTGATIFDVT